jgi:hypothetical protein
MSYISNGCNDCSSVDFGNNMMGNMMGGNMNGGMMGGGNQNMFETSNNGNQFVYQQQVQSQPVQPAVQQMPQMPQMQQMPQVQQVQQLPVQPKVQMVAPAKLPQQVVSVSAPGVKQQQSQSISGVLGNYFYDNAFTITIAFLVASAWHTTIKYYIDHAIKFSGGTPTYYVGYAVLVTIAAIFLTTLKH